MENGTRKAFYEYDAFGNEKNLNPDDENPFRYCGEYFDVETKTVYLRKRNYKTELGRFSQEDPHWGPENMIYGDAPVRWNDRKGSDDDDPLGLNLYTCKPEVTAIMQNANRYVYGLNNPVSHQDPSGEIVPAVAIPIAIAMEAMVLFGIGMIALYYCRNMVMENQSINSWSIWSGKANRKSSEGRSEAIEIPDAIPEGYVIATTAIPTLERGKYYPAFLDWKTNNVWIGPKITEEYAMLIIGANAIRFGVFCWAQQDAKSLASRLGTPILENDPNPENSGYYKHYHVMLPILGRSKSHIWYFI